MQYFKLFKPSLRRFSTSYNPQIHSLIQRLQANDPNLRGCYINTSKLDAPTTRDLFAAIGQNKFLQNLGLEGANIGDAGLLEVAKCIRLNTRLQELSLFHTGMTSHSSLALASALGESESLSKFLLSNNTFDQKTTNAFKTALCWLIGNCRLNAVGFNNIGRPAAQQLLPVFKSRVNLAYLECSDNQLDDLDALEIAATIETNPELAYVDLSNNQIGKAGAMAIMSAMQGRDASYPLVMNLSGNPISAQRITPR